MSVNFDKFFQYDGNTWQVLTKYLLEVKANKVGLLVASNDHDESNRIRGAISMINQILALEETAKQSQGR